MDVVIVVRIVQETWFGKNYLLFNLFFFYSLNGFATKRGGRIRLSYSMRGECFQDM